VGGEGKGRGHTSASGVGSVPSRGTVACVRGVRGGRDGSCDAVGLFAVWALDELDSWRWGTYGSVRLVATDRSGRAVLGLVLGALRWAEQALAWRARFAGPDCR
jgi:hypothetical protein